MPKIPKKKKKKKKERSDVEDSAGADKDRGEIADKIQELKITRAKSKSLFTRRKNQLLDSLDDAFSSGYREIRNFRKLLDEALERVIEDLTSLAELYSKAKIAVVWIKQAVKLRISKKNLPKLKSVFKSIWM